MSGINRYSRRYTFDSFSQRYWGKKYKEVDPEVREDFWEDFRRDYTGGLARYKQETRHLAHYTNPRRRKNSKAVWHVWGDDPRGYGFWNFVGPTKASVLKAAKEAGVVIYKEHQQVKKAAPGMRFFLVRNQSRVGAHWSSEIVEAPSLAAAKKSYQGDDVSEWRGSVKPAWMGRGFASGGSITTEPGPYPWKRTYSRSDNPRR